METAFRPGDAYLLIGDSATTNNNVTHAHSSVDSSVYFTDCVINFTLTPVADYFQQVISDPEPDDARATFPETHMSANEMTRRERLLAAHRGDAVDRPPIKIWAADPWTQVIHPSFRPILDEALEKTDLVAGWGAGSNMFYTRPEIIEGKVHSERNPSQHDDYEEIHTQIDTPKGPLHTTFLAGTRAGIPGYTEEYLFKTPEDVEKWLSVPYEPSWDESGHDCDSFFERDREMGDRGIVMIGFGHPMYTFQAKAGSVNFAMWSVMCRDVIYAFLDEILKRQLDYVHHVIRAGCGPIWGYVGPELCVPPLMSPADFDDFVVRYDRPITDAIHAAGNIVWCHSHGNMSQVLEKFIDLGADALNPL